MQTEDILDFKASLEVDYHDIHEAREILIKYGIDSLATVTEVYNVSELNEH